ncbi:RHS repeat-associated core domain-containing protein [Providencia stuartii]|uniref:RHS repeat-associated core domain-containing protein n=1 Tax=Providencia stuartii TaxID=588 RepID=UPI0013D442CA|nr:RHS repeat-associated core domain-containing protein [Providencia stuartii]
MPEAARVGDIIGHSKSMWGMLIGTVLGAAIAIGGAVISGALMGIGIGTSCVGIGFFAIGASVAIGYGTAKLAEWARDKCVETGSKSLSPCGEIKTGSHNVRINGKAAAISTRSDVKCDKENSLRQMAQGSDSVYINGFPASRVGDKTTCDATVMEGSPNVRIGGGTQATEDIEPEIPSWVTTASDLTMLFAGFLSFGGGVAKGPSAVAKLWSKLPGSAKISRFFCRYGTVLTAMSMAIPAIGILTRPVEVIGGQKVLNGEDELDFIYESELPLHWQRNYLSSYCYEGVLGRGWSFFWETQLIKTEDGFVWQNLSGDILPFPDIPLGYRSFCEAAQGWMIHNDDDSWTFQDAGELRYHYPPFDTEGRSRLSHVIDNVGNEQRFHYNEQHQLIHITGCGDLNIVCEYQSFPFEEKTVSRLTAVYQVNANQARRRQCAYFYNEHAQLVRVEQHTDHPYRQFGWTDAGIMAWHTDKYGLRSEYRWELSDDNLWRVIENTTSEGESYRLEYDDIHLTRTAYWHDGSTSFWQLNDNYQIIQYTDRTSIKTELLWDEFGLPCGCRNAEGHTQTSEWDELGRLLSLTDGNGNQTRWQYQNERDRLIAVFWPDGTESRLEYDRFGRLIKEISPLEQTTEYRYDFKTTLRPTVRIDAKQGRSEFLWTKRGLILRHRDCSGKQHIWRYDNEGRVVSQTNALQEATEYQYDEAGRVTRIVLPDESTVQLAWNAAGLLTHHQRNDNTPRQWQYNAFGRVTTEIDKLARHIHYHYNAEGALISIENANGGRYLLNRDAEGRLVEEIRPDDTLLQYRYNSFGRLAEETRLGDRVFPSPARTVLLQYDPAGNLAKRETLTDSYQYQWDSLNRLLVASRQPNQLGLEMGLQANQVHFTYDALGRITREQTGDDIVEFAYDELNNLSCLTLPQGDSLNWLYYGSGHATAINHLVDGTPHLITEFERDDLHREISRTQGALTQYRQYDKLGRTISTFSSRNKPHPLNGIASSRKWFYDEQDNLGAMEDHYRGWVEYLYDSEQRLKKVSSGENMDAMLFYDRADNLLERPQSEIEAQTPSMPALSPQGDRLLQFQGWQYRHDAYGNVISRGHPNQAKQTYQYDGDNRLVIAQTSDMKAQYHYDALGRRIHKVVESRAYGTLKRHETHFVWQGLRLLQEQDINTGKCQTYCYEEHGSYTPLAVIVKQPAGYRYYWHHCDINSAPLDVTNEQGNTVWSGKYERFGFVRSSPLSFYSDPERKMESFEQNLRYAGQYFDNETGLHFNTFRFYDPQIGRFIMPDPIGLLGGMNLYQYAPNPLVWIDPWGLAASGDYKEMPVMPGFQKHHNIPQSMANHPAIISSGYDINNSQNITQLPSSKTAIEQNPERTVHRGRHNKAYDSYISNELDKIHANNASPEIKRMQIQALSDDVGNRLRTKQIKLNNAC